MSSSWLILLIFVRTARTNSLQSQTTTSETLPAAWSWRDVGGHDYLTRIQSEHTPKNCKGSHILSTAAALSARIKIHRKRAYKHPDTVLSSQVLLNCVKTDSCSGGTPEEVLQYIKQTGIPDETCQNYEGIPRICDPLGICRDCTHGTSFADSHCWAVKNHRVYKLHDYGKIDNRDHERTGTMVSKMMNEIHNKGPITCEITPTPQFVAYVDGILSEKRSQIADPHYVNVIGWDTSGDTPYWLIRNCWGDSWGVNGFAKIAMGISAYGIESRCYWGSFSDDLEHAIGVDDDEIEDRGLYRIRKNAKPRFFDGGFVPAKTSLPNRSSIPENVDVPIPASYDIRDISGINYATIDKNQHIPQYCGSCWLESPIRDSDEKTRGPFFRAFASLGALADRFALLHGQASSLLDFSTQALMNCMPTEFGPCFGAWHYDAYDYTKNNDGIPHQSCAAYLARDDTCTELGTVSNTCKSFSLDGDEKFIPADSFLHFEIEDWGVLRGEEAIMREIAANGPIVCTMCLTEEFAKYAGGIFVDTTCCKGTGHAIEVAGWGEEDGVPYWIIRNTWGTYWGERGWGRIRRGDDCDMGIHLHDCSWSKPKRFHRSLVA